MITDLKAMQAAILRKHGKEELAEVLQPALVHGEPGQWLNPSEIGHDGEPTFK